MFVDGEKIILPESAKKPTNYSVTMSAKAVQLLACGIYQKPLESTIRELLCNAADAHRVCGKESTPIDFTYAFNDGIRIRDYGMGMDPDDVVRCFSEFFTSDKEQDDDVTTGHFGLGAKSPLSVAENGVFYVISRFCGYAHVFKSEMDPDTLLPSLSRMSVEMSDSPDGLEVWIPELKSEYRQSYNDVERTARQLARWVTVPVRVCGDVVKQIYPEVIDDNPWFTHKEASEVSVYRPCPCLSLNVNDVAYPINTNKLPIGDTTAKAIRLHRKLSYDYGKFLVIQALPSEVDITPSREELQYTKKTTDTIEKLLSAFFSNVYETRLSELFQAVEDAPCYMDATNYIDEIHYLSYVLENVEHKSLRYKDESLWHKRAFDVLPGCIAYVSETSRYRIVRPGDDRTKNTVDTNVEVYVKDCPGARSRVKRRVEDLDSKYIVIFADTVEAARAQLIACGLVPTSYKLASSLPAVPRAPRGAKKLLPSDGVNFYCNGAIRNYVANKEEILKEVTYYVETRHGKIQDLKAFSSMATLFGDITGDWIIGLNPAETKSRGKYYKKLRDLVEEEYAAEKSHVETLPKITKVIMDSQLQRFLVAHKHALIAMSSGPVYNKLMTVFDSIENPTGDKYKRLNKLGLALGYPSTHDEEVNIEVMFPLLKPVMYYNCGIDKDGNTEYKSLLMHCLLNA